MKFTLLFFGKSDQEASVLAIQANAVAVLQQFAPGGEVQGDEYVALHPRRADSNLGSFKINMRTGAWADFATGDKGEDFISYIAYCLGVAPEEALAEVEKTLAALPARDTKTVPPKSKGKVDKTPWQPILPVPDDAPPPPEYTPGKGEMVTTYPYRDQTGKLLFLIHRVDFFNRKTGKPDKRPLPLCYLSTGPNPQRPGEFLELFGEVQGDVAEEVKPVAEQRLEGAVQGFF